jgi:hypothetical protein
MSNNQFDMLNTIVDVEYFNNLLKNKGGKGIKTFDKKIVMRDFINKLIKTFRKDFMKKTKKGGMAELYPSKEAFNYPELTFKEYQFIPQQVTEIDML